MKKRNTTQRIHAKRIIHSQSAILLLTTVLAITLAVLLTNQVQAHSQRDDDTRTIENIVTTAMVTPASITVGNPASLNLSKNSIGSINTLRQTSTNISLAISKSHAIFSSIYSPSCSGCQILASNIDTSLAAEAKGQFHALGGGIRDIQWRQVLIDGSTASVTVSATIWSQYAYLDQQSKVQIDTPVGGYVYIYALTKSNGQWLITNQVEDNGAENTLSINQHPLPSVTPSANQQHPIKKITAPIKVKGKLQPIKH
jgi:hypothetical protein